MTKTSGFQFDFRMKLLFCLTLSVFFCIAYRTVLTDTFHIGSYYFEDYLTLLKQDNPQVIDVVRELIEKPAPFTSTYNFSNIKDREPRSLLLGQYGELGDVVDLFKGKRGGFFIESGALDGESLSNTLLLELEFSWRGLLIEANPESYTKLKSKHRKCHSLNVGLCKTSHPMEVQFEVMEYPAISGIIEEDGKSARQKGYALKDNPIKNVVTVHCFPLYSILMAIGNPTVDYFSLDVEGTELGILESIPWDKVDIRILQIEYTHVDDNRLAAIMDKAGYDNPFNLQEDMIFVKRTI